MFLENQANCGSTRENSNGVKCLWLNRCYQIYIFGPKMVGRSNGVKCLWVNRCQGASPRREWSGLSRKHRYPQRSTFFQCKEMGDWSL